MSGIILSALGASLLGNGVLIWLVLKPRKSKKKYDLTASDLLHDLTVRGQAILRVEVIDPTNLLLRSPRA